MKTLGDIFGVKIEKDTVKKRPMRVEDIDCSSRLEKYFKEHNSKVEHGKNKMREEFEKMPEIAARTGGGIYWNEYQQKYQTDLSNLFQTVCYLNGAWYAYQEQQKRIDKAIEHLDSIKGFVWYKQIKELLKLTH
jgi:hypothetical protein